MQYFKDMDGNEAAFVIKTNGAIALQLTPRRAAAVKVLWDDIMPHGGLRNDEA